MRRILFTVLAFSTTSLSAGERLLGASKIDITPAAPVFLSGYSDRKEPFVGVDEPIWARTLVMKDGSGPWTVWTTVELLGVSPAMRDAVLKEVEPLGVAPSRFALCATHTHTAPQLTDVAKNILAPRLTGAIADRRDEYTRLVPKKVAESIKAAIQSARPGKLELGWTEAHFAANRRVLKDGKCVAMGPFADGPTDSKVPVLRATSSDGKPIAILFNYACHATTLEGRHNRIAGDWPGLAATGIEQLVPGAVAIPMIGCGADTNPQPRGEKQMAIAHGKAMTDSVMKALAGPMRPSTANSPPSTVWLGSRSFAPIRSNWRQDSFQTTSSLNKMPRTCSPSSNAKTESPKPTRSHPSPAVRQRPHHDLHGGRSRRRLCPAHSQRVCRYDSCRPALVTAYANDVYGYLASERMIQEGGYEYDYSMVFYDQPGPWASGTEEAVIARVHDLIERPTGEGNLSPRDSLQSISVAEGLEVEQVASEPLVMDPVNIAFGADGRLWVAEMSDYPLGSDNQGSPGGRVRYLEDTNGDGKFDKSTLLLDGLQYTTGVLPYRQGVLISSTPEVFYVEVDPKTGKAGKRTTILDGFGNGNPQHVVNGFATASITGSTSTVMRQATSDHWRPAESSPCRDATADSSPTPANSKQSAE